MTAIAVPCPAPGSERIHGRLVADTTLEPRTVSRLFAAICQDTILAAAESNGEPFVVPLQLDSPLPEWHDTSSTAESLVTAVDGVTESLPILEPMAQRTDWVSHLFDRGSDRSDAASVGILSPVSPLVKRRHVDAAAMQLRTNDVVVGPSTAGTWYFAGIEREHHLTDVDPGVAMSTLATAARESDASITTLPFLSGIHTDGALATTLGQLTVGSETAGSARSFTREWMDETGLKIEFDDGMVQLVRDDR